jgi:hypothetical protein
MPNVRTYEPQCVTWDSLVVPPPVLVPAAPRPRTALEGPGSFSVAKGPMANDHGEGARLMRIADLRRRLAVAFERLQLTSKDAEGTAQPGDPRLPRLPHLANARVIG